MKEVLIYILGVFTFPTIVLLLWWKVRRDVRKEATSIIGQLKEKYPELF